MKIRLPTIACVLLIVMVAIAGICMAGCAPRSSASATVIKKAERVLVDSRSLSYEAKQLAQSLTAQLAQNPTATGGTPATMPTKDKLQGAMPAVYVLSVPEPDPVLGPNGKPPSTRTKAYGFAGTDHARPREKV